MKIPRTRAQGLGVAKVTAEAEAVAADIAALRRELGL
jgi:hypothetical protein